MGVRPDVRERDTLTPVELVELAAIARGLTAREASADRWVSIETTKNHRSNLLMKLGARTSAQAIHRAHLLGLLGDVT